MHPVSLLPSPNRRDLQLSLRAVTPVALHGVDPAKAGKQDASVRGALHRWLWILLGGIQVNSNRLTPRDVALAEARIFGTTRWSPGLSVRISGTTPLQGNTLVVSGTDPWAYVGWSLQGKGVWPARSLFKVAVDAGPQVAGQPLPAEDIALAAACWCWATLGWLGGRGRRGFGAFRCEHAAGPLAEAFAGLCGSDVGTVWIPPVTPGAWPTFLQTGISGALAAVAGLCPSASAPAVHNGVLAAAPGSAPPVWPGFTPGHWGLRLIKYQPGATWENALAEISEELRIIREDPDSTFTLNGRTLHKTHDLQPLNRALAGLPGATPANMPDNEFGLPRQYRINNATYTIQPRGVGIDRRPSPVIVRPVALDVDGNDVAVLWLALRSQFLPAGVPIVVRQTATMVNPPPPQLPQIVAFMSGLTASGRSLANLTG